MMKLYVWISLRPLFDGPTKLQSRTQGQWRRWDFCRRRRDCLGCSRRWWMGSSAQEALRLVPRWLLCCVPWYTNDMRGLSAACS